ncbi:pol, partial [Symbiodinium sp. CCMP2456]
VAGQPEGTTLLECIETGAVPFPERMSYVRWLEWRKETGSRPVKRRDGRSTSTTEEVALWRSVMDFLHDVKEEEEEDEEEEEEEDDEEESPPPAEAVDDPDGSCPAAPAAPTTGVTGLAAVGNSALAVVPLSADRRAGLSGPPSTAGSVPATAESLQADLREMYRPDQEPVADYLTRISRIVLALRAHGVAVSSSELDMLTTKATLLAEEFGQVGGDWRPTRMVRRLRTRFTVAALKEGDDGGDVAQKEIQASGVPPPTFFWERRALLRLPSSRWLWRASPKAASKEQAPAAPPGADGLARGDSPLRARLAALEMEMEALKRGSDGGASVAEGGQAADLAAALKEQTEALKEALSSRSVSNSITTVKTDLVWPTLTDDKSDTKDVVEEFEDVCALANNCRGMSAREKLLALRARCKGSRAKTDTNAYKAASRSGEVMSDPESVYLRIKNKRLMFGESREEREGRLSGHQFEPLFEASVADLESVGLGKTARELYLSYLRKMPPHLQKEIRQECHKVVLEYEQREEIRLKAAAKAAAAKPSGAAARDSTLAAGSGAKGGGKGAASKICFHFRDHENCPKRDSCPFSQDKELRKQALAAKRGESTLAAKGGKGGGKGGGKAQLRNHPALCLSRQYISAWTGVAAARAPLRAERLGLEKSDETLAAVAQQSAELVQEVGAEAARTVQVAAVSVIVLMLCAAAIWFIVRAVGSPATFTVTGRRKGCAGINCDAAVRMAEQLGLVAPDLATSTSEGRWPLRLRQQRRARGVLLVRRLLYVAAGIAVLGRARSRDKVYLRAYSFDAPSILEALEGVCARGAACSLIADASQCGKTKLQWQSLKRVATAGVSVRLAAGHSVRDAYLSDGRGATVGAGLKGLRHSKALLLVGETTAQIVVASLSWSTSSKANAESGLHIAVASGAPVVTDFVRDFDRVYSGASALDDAKPPGPKARAQRALCRGFA